MARQKLSLTGPTVYPHTAFVDPELSDTVPYGSTLNTGLDAINQAAESIWNRNMTPISEMLAHRALRLGLVALPKLLNDLENQNLRNIMAEVSLLAGFAISQTRTSLCHSISYPLTAHFGVPHGLACSFTMSAVLRHNLAADDGRLKRLAAALDASESSNVALAERFENLTRITGVHEEVRQQVPSLDVLTGLVDEMYTPGRADNNLGSVSSAVIEEILIQSWAV
jgi:alcohol dehydrogenase